MLRSKTTRTSELPVSRKLEAALGTATYSQDGVSIYHGDCLELMPSLPDGLVSLTVTSPPYNIGKSYEVPLELTDYLDWCQSWIGEIYRLTSPTGALWLNLGYLTIPATAKALPIAYLLWDRIPFYILQEVVWQYGAGVSARRSFSPRNEKFLWCVKDPSNYVFNLDAVRDPDVKYPNQRKNGKLKCNPLGKNPGDVWYFPKVTSGSNRASPERTDHPAQFPVAVIDRIVKASSNQGDLVFDPFIGSGTTAEVCLANQRLALGIEISKEYVDIAKDRIDRYIRATPTRNDRC